MIEPEKLRDLTGKLLDAALREGASEADAMASQGLAVSVDVRDGRLEHAERADGIEIGLRVLIGGRQATVSASDISDRTIAALASRAIAMAREATVDDSLGLADPDQLAQMRDSTGLELCDTSPAPLPEALRDIALAAEAAARANGMITAVESASASYSESVSWLQATNGFSGGAARTGHAISTIAIAGSGQGMERDWAGESRVFATDLPEPAEIGALAAERTVARLGARKPPTGAFPVYYDQRVSAGLIGHLLSAANGAAVARGSSWLRKEMGEPVLPPGWTLAELPHLKRMGASCVFDGEGLATSDRLIVEDGVLKSWTLDLASARKLGLTPTANARRGTGSPPAPGVSNIRLTPGTATPDDLIAQMGRGLVVTSMLGASINPTTGDYSRGAAGFWVENGQIAYPVNECTIAGNLREMLMRMTAANDLPEWRSMTVPGLLVEGMTIAGE